MKRPIVACFIYLTAGILAGQYITDNVIIALFFALVILTGFIIKQIFNTPVLLYILCVLMSVIGFLEISLTNKPDNEYINNIIGSEVTIYGTVTDSGFTSEGNNKATVKTEYIISGNKKISTVLSIILYIKEPLIIGQQAEISGILESFDFKRNPGGFDESLYAKIRKFDYKMYSENVKSGSVNVTLSLILQNIKNETIKVFDKVFPEKHSGIMQAIILGEKSNLDTNVSTLYRESGIYHILAISGMHISLLTQMLLSLFKKFKVPVRISAISVVAIIILYTIMTGASVSSVRAMTMGIVYNIATVIKRDNDAVSAVAFAAIVLLLYNVYYLFDIGFQLSFVAVAGIILITPVLTNKLIMPLSVQQAIAASVSATIVTYPVLAYHFYSIPVLALFINIILLPFASLIFILGIVIAIVGYISVPLASIASLPVISVLNFYEYVCGVNSSISFATFVTGQVSLLLVTIYFATIALFTLFAVNNSKRTHFFGAVSCFVIFIILFAVQIFYPKPFSVVFLDVGQGDSTVIHYNDKTILIDGGGNNKPLGKNTGTRVLAPYLNYCGTNYIDAVFVSHPDGDHILGIIELIELIDIKEIFVSDVEFSSEELYNVLAESAAKHNIPITKLSSGYKLDVNELKFEILYPGKNPYYESTNNASLLIKMLYKEKNNNVVSFLFTGDIETIAEQEILSNNSDINVNVLKVAHHGSKTSSIPEFIKRVSPQISLIGVSKNNTYGHPADITLQTLMSNNSLIYTTAENGAIILKYNTGKIKIETMLQKSGM